MDVDGDRAARRHNSLVTWKLIAPGADRSAAGSAVLTKHLVVPKNTDTLRNPAANFGVVKRQVIARGHIGRLQATKP
jgi:hypothetical protein